MNASDLSTLKWLILPLYPLLIIMLFGAWIVVRFRRERHFSLHMGMLGLKIDISVGHAAECAKCGDLTLRRRFCDVPAQPSAEEK